MTITTVKNSALDNSRLSRILTPIDDTLKNFDFSKVIVNKPWGYEYLTYSNGSVALWIMHIKKDFGNSMHCHLNKKTALLILSGKAVFSTLDGGRTLKEGDGAIIDKKVFHSTQAVSEDGIVVMELETPVNKVDLLRLSDSYGRASKGYESKEEISRDLSKYGSVFFENDELDSSKKIGNMNFCFRKFDSEEKLREHIESSEDCICTIIKGRLINYDTGEPIVEGDMFQLGKLKDLNLKIINESVTLLEVVRAHEKEEGYGNLI